MLIVSTPQLGALNSRNILLQQISLSKAPNLRGALESPISEMGCFRLEPTQLRWEFSLENCGASTLSLQRGLLQCLRFACASHCVLRIWRSSN